MKLTAAISGALALACLLATGPTRAQPAPGSLFDGDEDERAALASAEDEKYIRAREQAEKVLARKPDSFLATWVLGQAFHYEEANLARSLFLTRRATNMLVARYSAAPQDPEARRWHRKLIEEETWLLGEMDRPLEVLALLDLHDGLYRPHLRSRRMWPLMKLERFDEARALGRELIHSDDEWERGAGYNGLIAVEGEANDRQACYDWGIKGQAATRNRVCVLAHNTSHSALALFRYDEAEALAKTAIKAEVQNCSRSPYSRLVPLYLVQGELQKALSAYRSLRKARPHKQYRVQFEMADRGQLAEILFVVGKFEKAEEYLRAIYEAPDRTGMTSASLEEVKLVDSLSYAMALDARLEQQLERVSVRTHRGMLERLQVWQDLTLRRWEAARTALTHAARRDAVAQLLRPYNKDLHPWTAGHAAAVLGAGVTAKGVAAARALDRDFAQTTAFFDAIEGEIAWRDDDFEAASELGEAALATLPKPEALLRQRVATWLGDIHHQNGDSEGARKLWHEVLMRFPTSFRHLAVRLPTTLVSDGSPLADAVQERLRGSRRLTSGGLFRLDIYRKGGDPTGTSRAEQLELCLTDQRGFQFGCASVEPQADPEDTVVAACDAFHEQVLAPRIELTQVDINSLDGSPIRATADEVLKGVLGGE